MPTERSLSDFLGDWEITRQIIPASGPPASFAGQATWRAVQGGAEYSESGILRLEGAAPMTAERRYLWGDDLSVRFEDGRDFHVVPAAGGQATHFCDPDTYLVTYDFADWPAFTVRYDVRGPRKAYAMISHYTRAAPA
ncbi:DUF6314 family protein [Tateyamaria armeniaca]|uniref:DUF6314 family protein n=1 Tax=Tateyamaria armeniaca TaxID=2518930 RepID=A0ABW8V053_9RHOB